MKIVTVAEMRAIEGAAVAQGVSLERLQQNAALAVADEIDRLRDETEGNALFLAGPGNNGRDALIAADLLQHRGWTVRTYLAPGVASEDILTALRAGGAAVHTHSSDEDLTRLRQWVADASVVVDGLLGIGIKGAVRAPMSAIIDAANESAAAARVPVVAVDLPSGIDADTGAVAGVAIRADYTVSLGCVKAGLLRLPAAEFAGLLLPVEIGLPPATWEGIRVNLLDAASVRPLMPERPLDAHKGTFGRVLVVAGSRNFVGAPYLVGVAAARSGCGLVTFGVPDWQRVPLATMLPEATYLPLLDPESVTAAAANVQAIAEALPDCAALAIGPGLGQGEPQSRLVRGVLEAAWRVGAVPAVVDADALNGLALQPNWWTSIGEGGVLTPHPGEMSRLMGLSAGEVNADRWGIARQAAKLWKQTVVLKGAFTVVAEPSGELWISSVALSALATGGTGDVLTGLVAGLMAQGAEPSKAARAAVFLHGAAAQEVLAMAGTDRLIASDLPPMIPAAIAELMLDDGGSSK